MKKYRKNIIRKHDKKNMMNKKRIKRKQNKNGE